MSKTLNSDILIIGAGLSGLSLAYFITALRLPYSVTIVDSKPAFSNDRTWCFWFDELIEQHFREVISKRWPHWQIGVDSRLFKKSTPTLPYCHISGLDFYQFVLDILRQNPNVQVHLNQPVTEIQNISHDGSVVSVNTPDYEIQTKLCFDSRQPSDSQASANHDLYQQFYGLFVETQDSCFQTNCATLMDFKSPFSEICFVYTLPFQDNFALIEFTGFVEKAWSWQRMQKVCKEYIRESLGNQVQFRTVRSERGIIPMFSHWDPWKNNPLRTLNNVYPLGTNSGLIKSSSGYLFPFVQGFSERLARTLKASGPDFENFVYPTLRPWFYPYLDDIFLRVIKHNPNLRRRIFLDLFTHAAPDRVARFMSEQASATDLYSVIRAMPPTPFIKQAIWSLWSQ